VVLVITDVSEEIIASIIRLKRISDLGTTLAETNNRTTLRRNITKRLTCSYTQIPEEVGRTERVSEFESRKCRRCSFLHVTQVGSGHTQLTAKKYCSLMIEALRSSETSVLTKATRRHIPDDGILNEFYNLESTLKGTSKTAVFLDMKSTVRQMGRLDLLNYTASHCTLIVFMTTAASNLRSSASSNKEVDSHDHTEVPGELSISRCVRSSEQPCEFEEDCGRAQVSHRARLSAFT
jgi:hypothetical protein